MGWESRGGYSYYYRKRREGGRVVSVYHGRGSSADFWAWLDEDRQSEQATQRAESKAERNALEAGERALDEYCRQVELLARVALMASGYRQHARGQWRKRRG